MKKLFFIILTSLLFGSVFAEADPQGVLKIDKITVKCGNEMDGKNLPAILTGVDPIGFKVLGGGYGKSKNTVYYGCKTVEGADLTTFKNLGKNYASDKNTVYLDGNKIVGSDPSTFRIVNGPSLSKDKNNVYNRGKKIDGLNPKTLKNLSNNLCIKDDNKVFCNSDAVYRELTGADAKTFSLIANGFAKDKNKVYINSEEGFMIIEGADPKTFKVSYQNFYISTDSQNTYCLNQKNDLNPKKIKITKQYVKDEQKVYETSPGGCNEIRGVDAKTFVGLGGNNYKDKDKVYINGKVLTGADTKTFRVYGKGLFKDKNHTYTYEGVIIK